MAIGSVYVGMASAASAAVVSIQPTGTVEAVIGNIGWHLTGTDSNKVELYRVGSAGTGIFAEGGMYVILTSATGYLSNRFYVSSGSYIQVKNVSGASGIFWWDGAQTGE